MLRGACALINPSYSETFGIICLEAEASGVPPIAARTGGIPEAVLDGKTGILLDDRDPASWAAAAQSVRNDGVLRQRLTSAAREFACQHTWTEMCIRDRGYLTLGQSMTTLSGGELQRLKLAGELNRVGSIYLLDEPTAGLHLSDVAGLITLFDELVAQGNTLILVEHNLQVISQADRLIDVGPGAGVYGGHILYSGTPEGSLGVSESVTGQALANYEDVYKRQSRARPVRPGQHRRQRVRPLRLLDRRRRLHAGRRAVRGRVAGRRAGARQPHRLLRRQPHHHRGEDPHRLR